MTGTTEDVYNKKRTTELRGIVCDPFVNRENSDRNINGSCLTMTSNQKKGKISGRWDPDPAGR